MTLVCNCSLAGTASCAACMKRKLSEHNAEEMRVQPYKTGTSSGGDFFFNWDMDNKPVPKKKITKQYEYDVMGRVIKEIITEE